MKKLYGRYFHSLVDDGPVIVQALDISQAEKFLATKFKSIKDTRIALDFELKNFSSFGLKTLDARKFKQV